MDNTKYLVSICVPVYGVEKYIERCAVSLFEQNYPYIEYIFVDDCTPDNSITILNDVIERYPNRKPNVHIICHDKNRGLAAARNTAVDAVKTDFLIHVDSDDWVDKNLVKELVLMQKKNNADIVTADAIAYYPNKKKAFKVLRTTNAKELTLNTIWGTLRTQVWGRLIRKKLYTDNNIRVVEGCNLAEDYQVMPKLIYFAQKVEWTDKAYYHYIGLNPSNYTNNFSLKNYEQSIQSFQIVYDFFSDKGFEYVDMCRKSEMSSWFGRLRTSLLQGNRFKDISIAAKSKIRHLNKRYMYVVPIYIRIIYYLPINVARLYLKFIINVENNIRFISKK